MVKPIKFEQARSYFNRTHLNPVRAAVKVPIMFSIAAVSVGAMGLIPALVPGLALSFLIEGVRYAINRKDKKLQGEVFSQIMETVKQEPAQTVAAELLKSTGRGEKALARLILKELQAADLPKFNEVATLLEATYKGRKLLGIPFKLIPPSFSFSAISRSPLLLRGGMLLVPITDQALKFSPLEQRLDTNVPGISEHIIVSSLLLAGYKLAANRPVAQTGFSLMLWGAVSNLVDKLHVPGVLNYIYTKTCFGEFNLADAAVTTGLILLGYGILKDK